MASAAASAENSNTSTDQEDRVSLAPSLPYEMVEAILVHLSAPDLLFAAANVPKLWRDVIETSKEVWKILARHRYGNENDSKKRDTICQQEFPIFNQEWRSIKCFFLKGTLFAHSDSSRNSGSIWVPGADNAPLEIFDATTSSLRYRKKGRTGCWYLQLFDLNGNLVCEQEVRDGIKANLERYFQVIVEGRENVERYLRGGRSIDQVPNEEDGGNPAKRRKRGSD